MFISEGFKFNREDYNDDQDEIKPKLDYSLDNEVMKLDEYLADVDKQNKITIVHPQRKDSETGFFESEGMLANRSREHSKVKASLNMKRFIVKKKINVD